MLKPNKTKCKMPRSLWAYKAVKLQPYGVVKR